MPECFSTCVSRRVRMRLWGRLPRWTWRASLRGAPSRRCGRYPSPAAMPQPTAPGPTGGVLKPIPRHQETGSEACTSELRKPFSHFCVAALSTGGRGCTECGRLLCLSLCCRFPVEMQKAQLHKISCASDAQSPKRTGVAAGAREWAVGDPIFNIEPALAAQVRIRAVSDCRSIIPVLPPMRLAQHL